MEKFLIFTKLIGCGLHGRVIDQAVVQWPHTILLNHRCVISQPTAIGMAGD